MKKQFIQKIMIIFMAVVASILTSCNGDDGIGGDTTTQKEVVTTQISFDELAQYKVIRSDSDEYPAHKAAATAIYEALHNTNGVGLGYETDWVRRGDEVPATGKEILIGTTNRPESIEASKALRYNDFVIRLVGERIVINGGCDDAVTKGVDYFIKNYIDSTNRVITVPIDDGYRGGPDYVVEKLSLNGIEIFNYNVVLADNQEFSEVEKKSLQKNADYIIEVIRNYTGYTLGNDNTSECKIVIGQSKTELKNNEGSYEIDGNTVYINGNGDGCLDYAVSGFLHYVTDGNSISGVNLSITKEDKEFVKVMDSKFIAEQSPINIYVSEDGDDSNDGSIKKPFATLEAARDYIRVNHTIRLSPINVIISEGDYYVSEGLAFEAKDSGHVGAPISYIAEEGADVRIIGGIKIGSDRISKVTDKAVLDRIFSSEAKDNLMQIDLSGISINEIKSNNRTGQDRTEIYYNGSAMEFARWPNRDSKEKAEDGGYLLSTGIEGTNAEGSYTVNFYDTDGHIKKYWKDIDLSKVLVFGYFYADWSENYSNVLEMDVENSRFVANGGGRYKIETTNETRRMYFYNILEEIDVPGEMYIDAGNNVAYFYPDGDANEAEIFIPTVKESLVSVDNASNLTFNGIDLSYSIGMGIFADNAKNIVIDDCEISHINHYGIRMEKSYDCSIINCEIFDTGNGGIHLQDCGDRKTLTPSNILVENNIIHDCTRIIKTYQSLVFASGCGITVRKNTLYNTPHQAIGIDANDLIIEYNEIYNAVTDTCDAGAIYWGAETV